MLGLQYLKSKPTDYVLLHVRGVRRQAGPGLAFFYYQPVSSVAIVPLGSVDQPFIFTQSTVDYQAVTIQGQVTYRVVEPEKTAVLLNFSIDGKTGAYLSDDPEKLSQRLLDQAQVAIRGAISQYTLHQLLAAADPVAEQVFQALRAVPMLGDLGLEILAFSILAIRPTPEMARALEADAREKLLQGADDAIYDRRNAAIHQERKIKENELNTEMAIQEKRRQIREHQAEAELAIEAKEQVLRQEQLHGKVELEQRRKALVQIESENIKARADAEAQVLRSSLQPLMELPPEVLNAIATQTGDPRLVIAQAIGQIANNAGKIGQLNLSPDLLESLLERRR